MEKGDRLKKWIGKMCHNRRGSPKTKDLTFRQEKKKKG